MSDQTQPTEGAEKPKQEPPYRQLKDCVEVKAEPDSEEEHEPGAQWLKELHGKVKRGEVPIREVDDPEAESDYSDRPQTTDPDGRFIRLVKDIGITRYARELAEVESKKLKDNDLFREFRKAWLGRKHQRDGAIIFGGEGTGKSVIATWACRKACRDGLPFDFIDAIEIAQVIGSGAWDRYGLMATTGILVVDECGDIDDIRGTPFAYLKLAINRRYRADKATILCSTAPEDEFAKKWGNEILDRFPIRVGSEAESSRPSGTTGENE